jgi:arginine/lysine/ornithine decarboxylase
MNLQLHPVPADASGRYGQAQQLVALLVRFETLLEADAPLQGSAITLRSSIKTAMPVHTLRQLCQKCTTCMPATTSNSCKRDVP